MAEFRNRKVGLIIFGIVQLIFGGFCALAIPLMIFGMVMSAKVAESTPDAPPMTVGMMIPSIAIYVMLATALIALGIGSILARRWARALTLVASWMWLVMGTISVIAMMFLFPAMFSKISAGSPSMPGGVEVVMMVVMVGMMSFIYIIIPGAFVLFYRSPHVKATCETLDPKPRWTDRCPLPVLGVSLLFGWSALFMPFMGFYGWVMPFFGTYLHGLGGAAMALVMFGLLLWLAAGCYRLQLAAWWGALALTSIGGISACITFDRVGLAEMYKLMNLPVEQADLVEAMMPLSAVMMAGMAIGAVGFATYLFFIRHFFVQPPTAPGHSISS